MELNILTHPEFGEVRTITEENGTILFCATDVAKILGYSNPRKAIIDHCKGVTKRYTLTKGGKQEISYIFEPDLYRLIAKSKLPLAVEFERWVFEKVLPSLRQNGFYANKEMVHNPDFLIELGKLGAKIKQEQAEKECLLEEVKTLTEVVADYKPKINYLDRILSSDCAMTTTQIAADYGISAIRLNQILNEERVQRKVGNQWVLYVNYMQMNLTQSETVLINNGLRSIVYTKWTQNGRLLIHQILTGRGFEPQ